MTLYAIEFQYMDSGGLEVEAGLFTTPEAAQDKTRELEKQHPYGAVYIVVPLELKEEPVVTALWDGGFDEKGKNADPATSRYRTRLATLADYPLASEWTKADPEHRDRMDGRFWISQDGCQSRLLHRGDLPMFFFRLEHVVRIHIQFPHSWHVDPRVLREALESGMEWLGSVLAATGVSELVFDSTTRLLRRFCTGRLRFTAEPSTLRRFLERPSARPQAVPDSEQLG